MADKVVRVKDVQLVEHEVRGDQVVLKLLCSAGGKRVRLEIPMCGYALEDVVRHIRKGVNTHVWFWQQRQKNVGAPE